jgi:branched-subunit amino acid aminotransferase/4-amino-4-deoxychorismate lyase
MTHMDGGFDRSEAFQSLALSNYGHFTTMRAEDGRVRGFSMHLERLAADCRMLFSAELSPDEVRHLVRRELARHEGTCVIRVTVSDPAFALTRPGAPAAPAVLVTCRPAGPPPSPARVHAVRYCRDLPSVKHTGLFGPFWQRGIAQRAGFDDALFVGQDGNIAEGPTWNAGFYDGQNVIWPRAAVLPGVTMRLLTRAHGQTLTAPVGLRDVRDMHAAFATNSATGVYAITAIDDVSFPADHPVIALLRDKYESVPPEQV